MIIGVLATCDSNILPEKEEDGSKIEQLGCIKAPELVLIFNDGQKINIDGKDQWLVYDKKQNIFFITLKINAKSDDPMLNQLFELSRPILDIDRIQTKNLEDQLILYYIVPSHSSHDSSENKVGTHYYKIISSTPDNVNQLDGRALFYLDVPPSIERASWLMDIEGNLVGIFTCRSLEKKTLKEIHWCTFISNNIDKVILTLLKNKANI